MQYNSAQYKNLKRQDLKQKPFKNLCMCVWMAVLVCVHTPVCVFVNMGVHMYIKCRGSGLKETVFSSAFPAFMFKTGSPPEPELTDLAGSLANGTGIHLSPPSSAFHACVAGKGFTHGASPFPQKV